MKLRDIRGRFSSGLFPLSFRRKVYLASMVFLLVLALLGKAGEEWVDKELHYIAAHPLEAAEIITPDTIEEMKNDVLDRLAKCENPHSKPIVFDTNGVASVGNFQWQPHSFQHYWEKKTGVKLSEKEAVIYALDDTKARELASYVIFETDKGVKSDWVNCNNWHGLQELVDFIKAHE
jgi:hypothetical protein